MQPAFIDIKWLLISEVYPVSLGITGVFAWIEHYTDVISVCNAGDCTFDFTELSMRCIFPCLEQTWLLPLGISIKTFEKKEEKPQIIQKVKTLVNTRAVIAASRGKEYPAIVNQMKHCHLETVFRPWTILE